MKTDLMFSSATPEWETPEDFFLKYDAKYHFTLDPASTDQNAKCENHCKPITNSDRIRAMSDEELAEFLCHNVSNGTVNCAFCSAAEFCRMGHNGWLDWLKQEVSE